MTAKNRLKIAIAVVIAITAALLLSHRSYRRHGLKAAFDAEFLTRPDGYKGLSRCYGFEFASEPVQMDPGLMYRAVSDGAIDVIDGFATDGRIPAYDLVVLEDDKGFFPPYYAAVLVRKDTLRKFPALEPLLDRLSGRITNEIMQSLNYKVDEKGRKAKNVAREFLISSGFIPRGARSGDGSTGSIRVGGKQFTEQEILGQILAVFVECSTDIEVIRKLNLGGTMICFNSLCAGDLDLYPEYTGTGWVNILKQDVISDPEKVYEKVCQEFSEKYDLQWLKPFGFNNTYTLTMRRKHAGRLGIATISDLVRHMKHVTPQVDDTHVN
jgi:osmoprotectant transport system permease protein